MLADDDLPEVVSIVSTHISECIRNQFHQALSASFFFCVTHVDDLVINGKIFSLALAASHATMRSNS